MHLLTDAVTAVIDTPYVSSDDAARGGGTGFFWYIVTAIGMWPMLTKSGKPGWGGFIPVYNLYLQIKLAGRSGYLVFLYLIPFVNIVLAMVIALGIGRAFGKGPVYSFVLLFLLQPIGYLVVGFGSSRFTEIRR